MADKTENPLLKRVLDCGVVAVLRLSSIESLMEIAAALVAGGVTNIELTLTTPSAIVGIRRMARELAGQAVIGAGTVLDAESCRRAVEGGAEYIVSPGFDEAVHAATRELGKLSMPGAMTPTEILHAWTMGADVVKVFPSAGLGPGYFRDVLAPLPFVRLMPTGGVDANNAGEWVRAGAVCVGAGSNLVSKEAIRGRDWQMITDLARAFVDAVQAARK